MGVKFPKIGVFFPPKMDGGVYKGKPYEQMDDLGGKNPTPIFGFNTQILIFGVSVPNKKPRFTMCPALDKG